MNDAGLPIGQGTIAVDGAHLQYERIDSQGPLIVVVPGGPGLGFHYLRDSMCDALGGAYGLLLYDQRGTGHSTGRDDVTRLTMNTFVEDLDALRRAAGCERVTLLGHSPPPENPQVASHATFRASDRLHRCGRVGHPISFVRSADSVTPYVR